MLSDWELWACAVEMVRQHGGQVPLKAAARIDALALEGDMAGVAAWKEIAQRVTAMQPAAVFN